MNRIIFYLSAIALAAGSCTSAIHNDVASPPDETKNAGNTLHPRREKPNGNSNLIVENEADMIGYWVGMFEPDTNVGEITAGEGFYWNYANKINISIDKIEQGKVWGHSIVAGNDRPFEGTVVFKDNAYSFTLSEPGDDKYDGAFKFTIKKSDSLLNGTWHAFKPIKIPVRGYGLQKMTYTYNAAQEMDYHRNVDWEGKSKTLYDKTNPDSDYDDSYFTTTEDVRKYNASKDLLTVKQVANLKKGDLFVLRNAIYARHGYSFKNRQLRVYFDQQPWYIPVSTNIKDDLSDLEKKNIDLLMRYEKNAKEYYDVFGRG